MSENVFDIRKYSTPRGGSEAASQIIAIGGGKGGIGKSFVSTNLAIFLANLGFNTVIVDLDLGAANTHTALGEPPGQFGLSDFVNGRSSSLESIAMPTKIPNLRLISGSNDELDMANLNVHKKSYLMSALHKLQADYIVLDLSAGTHNTTIDFFLLATHQMVVFTPEPSSIENAYRFMKAAYFRKIKRHEVELGLKESTDFIMSKESPFTIKTPVDLMNALSRVSPEKSRLLIEKLQHLNFQIILNQSRTHKDAEIGLAVESVSKRFFGLPSQFVGHLDYDNAVWQSLRKRRPLLLECPHSPIYAQILQITKLIAYPKFKKAVI